MTYSMFDKPAKPAEKVRTEQIRKHEIRARFSPDRGTSQAPSNIRKSARNLMNAAEKMEPGVERELRKKYPDIFNLLDMVDRIL